MIVVDTNVIAYLLIEGDRTEEARRTWLRDRNWIVPPLWRSEFLNVLWVSVRAGVLQPAEAHLAWQRAAGLLAGREREPAAETVLDEAIARGISAYDAHFVVVAASLRILLVTADNRLARACPVHARPLEAFAAGA